MLSKVRDHVHHTPDGDNHDKRKTDQSESKVYIITRSIPFEEIIVIPSWAFGLLQIHRQDVQFPLLITPPLIIGSFLQIPRYMK